MQSVVPKQFLLLKDKPILMHTMQTFHDVYNELEFILVLPGEHISHWETLCEKHHFDIAHQVCSGGDTRFYSVRNGLELIPEEGLVAIHDGVRPLVSEKVIVEGFELAAEKGNAIPCVGISESVRIADGTTSLPADRSVLRIIQTPEVFRVSLIKRAYQADYHTAYTDDASVLERMGEKIHLFPGNPENIKITGPTDLVVAEAFLDALNS